MNANALSRGDGVEVGSNEMVKAVATRAWIQALLSDVLLIALSIFFPAGQQVSIRDLFHPVPIHAEVIIARPGSRAKMDETDRVVEGKLHIIHETEDPRPELRMHVGRSDHNDLRPLHLFQDSEETIHALLSRPDIGKRGHGPLRIFALCGNTVGRPGARGESLFSRSFTCQLVCHTAVDAPYKKK